jgi:rare lipoprotein A
MLVVSFFIFILVVHNCTSSPRYHAGTIRKPVKYKYDEGMQLRGKASYYGEKFHGRQTASGEIFNMYALTAAHQTLPFGTQIQVTNMKNNKSVIVRINDRGPFTGGRILDLSYRAAREIQMIASGTVEVKIKIIRLGRE